MPAISKNRSWAYLFLLLNTALWGFASPIIKYSLSFTNPSTFLFYRYLIATLFFLPVFLIHKSRTHKQMDWKLLIILALLGTPLTLLPLFYGLQSTTSIEASILVASSPVFTILGSLIYLKEKLNRNEWIGVLIAVSGTLLLAFDPVISGYGTLSLLSLKGNLLILVSNIIWAAFLILSKKDHVDPITLTFTSFLISLPFFWIFSNAVYGTVTLDNLALPGIAYMAIFGSIIGFWAYQEGQKRIEASEAAIFTYLQPAFALPLSLLWLHEKLTVCSIISTLLIVLGVYISEKR